MGVMDVISRVLHSVVFSLKTCNPDLLQGNHQMNPVWGPFNKKPAGAPQDCPGHEHKEKETHDA